VYERGSGVPAGVAVSDARQLRQNLAVGRLAVPQLGQVASSAALHSSQKEADVYDGNCSTCHGADAGGAESALGVRGPDVACTEAGDFAEKISQGDNAMPAFPELVPESAVIAAHVRGAFCRD
jgi:mono/diheme cytochrome c family protein